MGVMRPDLIMKSVIPVVMAGIIAIYGLVVAVLIASRGALSRVCPCVQARERGGGVCVLFVQCLSTKRKLAISTQHLLIVPFVPFTAQADITLTR